MKKFPLHWQILVALILAIVFGLVFKTHYVFNAKNIEKIANRNVPEEVLDAVKSLDGMTFYDQSTLTQRMNERLDHETVVKYKGLIFKQTYVNPAVKSISWMGDIFLRLLKMLILPLILFSIITAVSNIGSAENLGRLGLKTFTYYTGTSLLAIVTGLFFVNLIKPGVGADLNFSEVLEGFNSEQKGLGQILVEIVPENIFQALVTNEMLSVIFFAIIFGFFITRIEDKYKQNLNDLFNAGNDVIMKIVLFVIKFTPFGVFGIVSKVISEQGNLIELAHRMGLYMLVVLAGLATHMFISLPLITRIIGKVRPFLHYKNMSTPLLTAFSTSSSGATLPLTMHAIEEKSGISSKISSFTLPLGATVNMDGTALYECVAAMFIAQAYGIEMSIIQQMIIIVTALLASIGAAAIPMAGFIMITVILTAVGLPLEGVGLILAVDRILDMFRTTVNVWSDCCGAAVIAKTEGEILPIDIKKHI